MASRLVEKLTFKGNSTVLLFTTNNTMKYEKIISYVIVLLTALCMKAFLKD